MSDILEKVAEEIYKYLGYVDDSDFSIVAKAIIKRHSCLFEPVLYNGCREWKQRLKAKLGTYKKNNNNTVVDALKSLKIHLSAKN